MSSVELGAVTVTRLMEWTGPVMTVDTFFPDIDHRVWADNEHWLAPDFWRPADDAHPVTLQSWLLRSDGKNILIDTGGGRAKQRPTNPAFDQLDTDLITPLATAGLQPDDIDVVINTHLHIDHVGWNTVQRDGEWTPTFSNATYFFPRADLAYYDQSDTDPAKRVHIDDSVVPVLNAGQAVLIDGPYSIDEHLTIEAAPGHTPGSSVVTLHSGAERAVFVGDVLHNPVQIVQPDSNSCFCLDPDAARASRRTLLSWAASNHALVFPAHFSGSGAAHVTHADNTFEVTQWAPFAAPPPI